ncbi:MAG: hypothetical protein ACRD2B_17140 [Terriglobia bacterium]
MLSHSRSRAFLLVTALGIATVVGLAQGRFETVTGKLFNEAVPRDFYLEGDAIPVEKLNATLIKTPEGARALFSLIATAGFASEIQQKYSGMLISEGHLAICGKRTNVGSYGFGVRRPHAAGRRAQFILYNQAGGEIMECSMRRDLRLREPKPLQIVIESSRSARLYLGRRWVVLGP